MTINNILPLFNIGVALQVAGANASCPNPEPPEPDTGASTDDAMAVTVDRFFRNLTEEIVHERRRTDALIRDLGTAQNPRPLDPVGQSRASATGESQEHRLIQFLLEGNMGRLISPQALVHFLGGTASGYSGTARYQRWLPQIATIFANDADIAEFRSALGDLMGPYRAHAGVEDDWRVQQDQPHRRLFALQEIYQRFLVLDSGRPNPRFAALIGENLYSQALIYKELGNFQRFRELLTQAEIFFRYLAIPISAGNIYTMPIGQMLGTPGGPGDRRRYLAPVQYQTPDLNPLPQDERGQAVPRMQRNLRGNFAFANYFLASLLITKAESLSVLNSPPADEAAHQAELQQAQALRTEAYQYLRNTRPSADFSLAYPAGQQVMAGSFIQDGYLGEFVGSYQRTLDGTFARGLRQLGHVLDWAGQNSTRITNTPDPQTSALILATNVIPRWLQTTIAQGDLTMAGTVSALAGRIREGYIPSYFGEYILPRTGISAPDLSRPESQRAFDEYSVIHFQDRLLAYSFAKFQETGNSLYNQRGLSSQPRLLSLSQRYNVYLAMAETLIRRAFNARDLGHADNSPEVQGRMAAAYRMLNNIAGDQGAEMRELAPHATTALTDLDAVVSDRSAVNMPGPDALTRAVTQLWLGSLYMSEDLQESASLDNPAIAAAQRHVQNALDLNILRGGSRQRAQRMLAEFDLWRGEFTARQGELYPPQNVAEMEGSIFAILRQPVDPFDASIVVRGLNDLIELYGSRPKWHPLISWMIGRLFGKATPIVPTEQQLAEHPGLVETIDHLHNLVACNRVILSSSTRAYLRLQAANALSWGWTEQQRAAHQILESLVREFPWLNQTSRPTRAISRARALYNILQLELALRQGDFTIQSPFSSENVRNRESLYGLVVRGSRDPDLFGRLVSLQVEIYSRQRQFDAAAAFLGARLNSSIGSTAFNPSSFTADNVNSALARITFRLSAAPPETRTLFKHRPVSFARYQLRLLLDLADNLTYDENYQPAMAILNHLARLTGRGGPLERLIGRDYTRQLAAQIQLRLGDVSRYEGSQQNWEASQEHYNNALRLSEEVLNTPELRNNPSQSWLVFQAKTHLGMAELYRTSPSLRNLATAQEHYTSALRLARSLPTKYEKLELLVNLYLGLANLAREATDDQALINIARVYRSQGGATAAADRNQANLRVMSELASLAFQHRENMRRLAVIPPDMDREVDQLARDYLTTSRISTPDIAVNYTMMNGDRDNYSESQVNARFGIGALSLAPAFRLSGRAQVDIGPHGALVTPYLRGTLMPNSHLTLNAEINAARVFTGGEVGTFGTADQMRFFRRADGTLDFYYYSQYASVGGAVGLNFFGDQTSEMNTYFGQARANFAFTHIPWIEDISAGVAFGSNPFSYGSAMQRRNAFDFTVRLEHNFQRAMNWLGFFGEVGPSVYWSDSSPLSVGFVASAGLTVRPPASDVPGTRVSASVTRQQTGDYPMTTVRASAEWANAVRPEIPIPDEDIYPQELGPSLPPVAARPVVTRTGTTQGNIIIPVDAGGNTDGAITIINSDAGTDTGIETSHDAGTPIIVTDAGINPDTGTGITIGDAGTDTGLATSPDTGVNTPLIVDAGTPEAATPARLPASLYSIENPQATDQTPPVLNAALQNFGINPPSAQLIDMNQNAEGWQQANWANHGFFNNVWRPGNIDFTNGFMNISLTRCTSNCRDGRETFPYASGEYRTTNETFNYGLAEARIRVARGQGTVTTFFSYTGEPDHPASQHDEIDFEMRGTCDEVQTNYYVNNQNSYENSLRNASLGFNPCDGYHIYAFAVTPREIVWYIDGREIRRIPDTQHPEWGNVIPSRLGRLMTSLWTGRSSNGDNGVVSWLGHIQPGQQFPIQASVDWIRITRQ